MFEKNEMFEKMKCLNFFLSRVHVFIIFMLKVENIRKMLRKNSTIFLTKF